MASQRLSAYDGDAPFVFVSYSHIDSENVYPHIQWLQEHGVNVWFDEGITPGHRWSDELAENIDRADRFLLFVTPASAASEHCLDETQFALNRHKDFLAVFLQPTELPPGLELSIANRQAIMAFRDGDDHARSLMLQALTSDHNDLPPQAPPPPARKSLRWPSLLLVVALVGMLAIGWLMLWSDDDERSRRIAVLPFNNYVGDEYLYLADGLADSLIDQLSAQRQLQVVSRASAFAVRHELARGEIDLAGVRERLNARYIVEGRLVEGRLVEGSLVEGSLRPQPGESEPALSVRLVDALEDTALWSKQWQIADQSLLTIQRDIALTINSLVSGQEVEQPATAMTDSDVAYDLYLRGLELLRGVRSPDNLARAEEFFDAAIADDAEFARAYAGLCRVFQSRYLQHRAPLDVALARQACARGVELEPDGFDVNLAMGSLHRVVGEYAKALTVMQSAIARQPGSSDAYASLGPILDRLGRVDEAEQAYLKAIEIEPGFWSGYLDLAIFYYDHVEYDKALELLRRTLNMPGADAATIQHNMATVALAQGDFVEAVAHYEEELKVEPNPRKKTFTNLGTSYYYLGCYAEASVAQRKAVRVAPDDHRVIGRLAESCRFVAGGEPYAHQLWAHAIRLQKKESNQAEWQSQGLIGIYHAHRGEHDLASAAVARMWQLDPEASIAHYFAAIVDKQAGRDSSRAEQEALRLGFPENMLLTDPDLRQPPVCPLRQAEINLAQVCVVD